MREIAGCHKGKLRIFSETSSGSGGKSTAGGTGRFTIIISMFRLPGIGNSSFRSITPIQIITCEQFALFSSETGLSPHAGKTWLPQLLTRRSTLAMYPAPLVRSAGECGPLLTSIGHRGRMGRRSGEDTHHAAANGLAACPPPSTSPPAPWRGGTQHAAASSLGGLSRGESLFALAYREPHHQCSGKQAPAFYKCHRRNAGFGTGPTTRQFRTMIRCAGAPPCQ